MECYIGQARSLRNLNRRLRHHKNRTDRHPLTQSINKYGLDNFNISILSTCEDLDTLDRLEHESISYVFSSLRSAGRNFNLIEGGKSRRFCEESRRKASECKIGIKMLEETKRKISKALRENTHNKSRLPVPSDMRLRISQTLKNKSPEFKQIVRDRNQKIHKGNKYRLGKKHSEETKELIRQNTPVRFGRDHPSYGKKASEETRKKISESNKGKTLGKPLSEETRKKISSSKMGKKHSEATKKRLSDLNRGKPAHNRIVLNSECVHEIILLRSIGITYKQIGQFFKLGSTVVRRVVSEFNQGVTIPIE